MHQRLMSVLCCRIRENTSNIMKSPVIWSVTPTVLLEMYVDQITFRFLLGLLGRLSLFAFGLAERNWQRLAMNNKKKPEPRGVKTTLPFQHHLKHLVCVTDMALICGGHSEISMSSLFAFISLIRAVCLQPGGKTVESTSSLL